MESETRRNVAPKIVKKNSVVFCLIFLRGEFIFPHYGRVVSQRCKRFRVKSNRIRRRQLFSINFKNRKEEI